MTSDTENPDVSQKKQSLGEMFGRAALTYDQVGPQFFSYFGRRLVELSQIAPGAQVLDIATGRGAVLLPAAQATGRKGKVIGIDISEAMIHETTQALDRQQFPQIELKQMDAEHLMFPEDHFDVVLCGFALFFFPQLERAMSEIRRVLKPGGRLAITTWGDFDEDSWSWFEKLVEAYLPAEDDPKDGSTSPGPVFDKPEGLQQIMASAGFANVVVTSEVKDFVYANEEEWWSTIWSHGGRSTLESIENKMGVEGLEKFKADAFREMQTMKQEDGYHQAFQVFYTLASKP